MKSIQPLRDNLLIEIMIPDITSLSLTEDLLKKKIQNCPFAKVLSIGPEVKDVKVGDTIYFQKWQKSEVTGIEEGGKLYALIHEEHIDAIYV